MMDYLAVVITPDEMLDPPGWQAWLGSLLQSDVLDEGVRLLVVDDTTSPLLAALTTTTSPLVVVSDLELTLPLAMEEIARASNNGSPEGRFRELVAGISRASSEGMESEARDLAQAALHLARAERWLDMECVVHAILGGVFLSLRRPERAVESYRVMGAVAEQLAPDDPARGAMLLQARLSEGSVHFGEESYGQAAECYEAAGASAGEVGNAIAQVDAWRMAGVCREMLRQEDQAVECFWMALEAGKSLASDQRRHSLLSHAGARLLGLTEAPARLHQRPTLEDDLAFLFGPQWRDELPGEEHP
jgi:tetratricopeptide (TPR) repeat protein